MKKFFAKITGSILMILFFTMSMFTLEPVQAQSLQCPQYVDHFQYVPKIKYCGSYFATWETCEFNWTEMCPCLDDESEPDCV